jgi:hypothetical protein
MQGHRVRDCQPVSSDASGGSEDGSSHRWSARSRATVTSRDPRARRSSDEMEWNGSAEVVELTDR